MQNKGALIFWGVVIVIGLCVGGYFGVRSIIRANTVAPFNKQIASYVGNGVPGPGPANNPNKGTGKIKGKVIPIDMTANTVDYIYFDLPDELRPAKPEDVGTVVLLQWGKNQVGTYTGGSAAYQQTVQVTVLDKDTRDIIGQQSFSGSMPPQRKKSSESGTGSKPETEVINFVKALPR